MCVTSMVLDHYRDKWREQQWFPVIYPDPGTAPEEPQTFTIPAFTFPEITRAEFDKLRADVAELKELFKRAKKYDEENGEPDCEIDEKVELVRRIAKMVGVDVDDIFGKKSPA